MDEMIRAAVFGAGQAGRMAAKWLPSWQQLICYIDNDPSKQAEPFDGVPVLPVRKALAAKPDLIWIAVLNRDSAKTIEAQLRSAGYGGRIQRAVDYRDAQDLRLASIRLIAGEIRRRSVPGAIAELGVFRGKLAAEMNRLFPDREILLFDTFEGFDAEDLEKEAESGKKAWHPDFSETSEELVRQRLPYPEKAVFIKGRFPDSLRAADEDRRYALVSLDPDLYEPTLRGLEYFYPRLSRGGAVVIHDYNSLQFPGVMAAAREYCDRNGLMPVPLGDLHGTAVLVRQ